MANREEVFQKVQEVISEALYVDRSEVSKNANLVKDLGAESIDFLDIIFRLEKTFDIKLPKGEIEQRAKGSLEDFEFAIEGIIQPKGLARLREVMPEVDPDSIKQGLRVREIGSLFTVASFERMVWEKVSGDTVGQPKEQGISTPPVDIQQNIQ